MKVLLFADTHGSSKSIENIKVKASMAELLVCAGDFTVFEDNMPQILQELNNIGKPVLIIHGNHETASGVMHECEQLKNLHFIHKCYYISGDIIFYGFGGGGFSFRDEPFRRESELFINEFNKLLADKRYRLVLVTHAPPYGTRLDYIGEHIGNRDIREFTIKHNPMLAISGHIHETFGAIDDINSTRIINPGPDGMIVEL